MDDYDNNALIEEQAPDPPRLFDDLPMAPEALLSWCKEQIGKARNDRIPYEKQWYTNMAFFFGKQWVQWWGGSAGFDYAKMYEPPKASWNARLTSNKIRPRVLKIVAKLNQERPRGFVVPQTSDDSDLAGARAAEKVHEYVTQEQMKLDQVMYWCDWWSVVCGTGFVKTYFDDTAKDPAGGVGLIRADELSPFHIFVPNLEVQDLERQPWVAHVCAKNVSELKTVFPHAVDLQATTSEGTGSLLDDRFQEALGVPQQTARQAVMYFEMYIKPNQQFPTGCKVAWANDELLDYVDGAGVKRKAEPLPGDEILNAKNGIRPKDNTSALKPGTDIAPSEEIVGPVDNATALQTIGNRTGTARGEGLVVPEDLGYEIAPPFINGMYPFVKRSHMLAGRFYATSPIDDMIPLQMEYNRGRSQIIESRNRTAKPQFLAPRGSIDPRKITSAPGQIIEYQPGLAPPQYLAPVALPQYVWNDLEMTLMDLDEASSMSEVSRGQASGRVEAATAIGMLIEEVDAILNLVSRDRELAVEAIGAHVLWYVQTYWDGPRTIKVVGDNDAFESYVFSSTELGGNTSYKVEPGSGAPMGRAAKQAFILELLKMQMIPIAQGLKYMKMGDSAKLYEEMQIDVRQAERENVKMAKGEDCLVHLYDNHMQHIQIHDDYAKRQEFENAEPALQILNRRHCYNHLKMLAQMAQVQLMLDPMVIEAGEQQMLASAPGPEASMVEMELRRIYDLLIRSGGVVPQTPGTVGPGGEANAPV